MIRGKVRFHHLTLQGRLHSIQFLTHRFLVAFFFLATVFTCFSTVTTNARETATGNEELYVSKIFIPPGGFTTSIEGPACDISGNLYAVNYSKKGAIGKVTPDGQAGIFVQLPGTSVGNGIRFNSKDFMFIADYVNHNIFKVDMKTREITVFAHESAMSQPNDIAIGANDILYASDPDFNKATGKIWRIDTNGAVTLLDSLSGTTNGIEVGADEKTLYVNESNQRNVWTFDLSPEGKTSNKRLLIKFADSTLDGMRCDIAGNLYITRLENSAVTKVSPKGEILQEIKLIGKNPSNLDFGGPDGRTCYVTLANDGSIETFRVDLPGRSWQLYQNRNALMAQNDTAKPQSFVLAGNYPNPFNSSTVIEYTVRSESVIELSVFNMLGQRVAVLKSGPAQPGKYMMSWYAGNLPSGTYFVRLITGSASETRKVMLLK
ncbi:MAG: SMP-30/gluconolactonase/LRE family protein [Candidatus Latescibacter sp.]|nr:SMP-30/gluconolactonase/LRE family protein [Candidatus Latescibacter sp.]